MDCSDDTRVHVLGLVVLVARGAPAIRDDASALVIPQRHENLEGAARKAQIGHALRHAMGLDVVSLDHLTPREYAAAKAHYHAPEWTEDGKGGLQRAGPPAAPTHAQTANAILMHDGVDLAINAARAAHGLREESWEDLAPLALRVFVRAALEQTQRPFVVRRIFILVCHHSVPFFHN